MAKACSAPKKPDTRECRVCGEVGHIARNCPTAPAPEPGAAPAEGGAKGRRIKKRIGTQSLSNKRCFNCGQNGHLSAVRDLLSRQGIFGCRTSLIPSTSANISLRITCTHRHLKTFLIGFRLLLGFVLCVAGLRDPRRQHGLLHLWRTRPPQQRMPKQAIKMYLYNYKEKQACENFEISCSCRWKQR